MRTPGVILLVAGPGYGKSAWIDARVTDEWLRLPADRVAPDQLHRLLADPPPAVAVEDLHLLDLEDRAAVVAAAGELGRVTAVVLSSRRPLEAKVRAALTGHVVERGPADLALCPAQVATILADDYSVTDPELPGLIHHATAGWPSLVHLAADTCERLAPPSGQTFGAALDDLIDRLLAPGGQVRSWIENAALPALSDDVAALVRTLADHPVVTADLASDQWGDDDEGSWVRTAYAESVRSGLVVPHPRAALMGRAADRVVPVIAAHLRDRPGDADLERLRRAAGWYERHDHPFAALSAWERAGDRDAAARVLREQGTRITDQGDAAGLVAHLESADSATIATCHPEPQRLVARARHLTGRAGDALGVLAPSIRAAEDDGWTLALALDVGALHFTQADFARARVTLDRIREDEVPDTGEGIRWRTLRVMVSMTLGERETAIELAPRIMRLAQESGDPADLAQAHLAMARISPMGHRKAAHLEDAARCARAAGDAVTLSGVLGTQAFTHLASAEFADAVRVGREAVALSELVRPMGALTAALHNLAEALCRVGDYDEARLHLRRAASVARRLGEGRSASSFSGLGDLYRARGQREQGRDAYAEAIRLARASGELQVLVPALAGLARLTAYDDPETARRCAEEALTLAPPSLRALALAARAVVEVASGERPAGHALATEAVAEAREEHALDVLADVLEVQAVADDDPLAARDALLEAWAIWRDAGAGPDANRILVRLARLEGADRETRDRGRAAADELQRLGVTRFDGRPVAEDPTAKDVVIRVLGGFEVAVRGRPVAMQAWKSRQARTLVKLLAARDGRPVSRDLLCEELWPDDDPAKTSHRLSVLLTTVRSVLDPGKTRPPDHYLASDNRGVWLDLRRVSIDAHDLIADAQHAADLLTQGRDAEAAELMCAVDRSFRGEAFEDEPYESWASDLRVEVRTAWVRSQRHLATIATRQRRHNDTVAILTRLLRIDPYDEKVHQGLVRTLARSGRHGEARRAFDAWVAAMAAVDAPEPDPQVLAPPPPRSAREVPTPQLTP